MHVEPETVKQYLSNGELTTSLAMAAQSLNQHIGFLNRDPRTENRNVLRELEQCENTIHNRPNQLNRKLKSRIQFLRAKANRWWKDTADKTQQLLSKVHNPLRAETLAQYHKHFRAYQAVYADYQAINWRTKAWELQHWFGLPQVITTEVITLYQKWGLHGENWERLKDQQTLRELFNPRHEETYDSTIQNPHLLPQAWVKYMQHCRYDSLQSKVAEHSSLSANHPDMKILVAGTAGRVLVTLEDKLPVGKGKFNGASLTMIFDEDARHPRGGIQSLICTKQEAFDLLDASASHISVMKPNSSIAVA